MEFSRVQWSVPYLVCLVLLPAISNSLNIISISISISISIIIIIIIIKLFCKAFIGASSRKQFRRTGSSGSVQWTPRPSPSCASSSKP